MRIWLGIASFIFGASALAAGNHRLVWQNSESVIQNFKDVSKCTERIWPGMSWSGYSILAVNEKKERQVALDIDSSSVFRISLDEMENSSAARSTYAFFDSDGKKWVSVNENYSRRATGPFKVFEIGAHEIFHHIGQKNWQSNRRGGRGTLLPVRWEPRYYRGMLQYHLANAFINKNSQASSLQKASYWFHRWQKEFPAEVQSTTDGYEGTAEYANIIAMALVKEGCHGDEESLRKRALEDAVKISSLLSSYGRRGLDDEGYSIGSLAALILRWDVKVNGWEARVEKGETPVEILLQSVRPEPEDFFPPMVERFQTMEKALQKHADTLIGDAQRTIENKSRVMLLMPYDWQPGSAGYRGFYVDTEKSTWYGILGEPLEFKSGESRLTSSDGLVLVNISSPAPCKQYGWSVPILERELIDRGDTFEIEAPKIRGTLKASLKVGSDGTKWLCGGE